MSAEQFLVRRDVIDAILAAVRSAGSNAVAVFVRDRRDVPALFSDQSRRLSSAAMWMMAASVALVLASGLSLWSAYVARSSLLAEVSAMEQGNETLRAEALRLQSSVEARDGELAKLGEAIEFLDQNSARLAFLAALTEEFDDTISISDLGFRGARVSLTAQAKGDGFGIAQTLTDLELVNDVRLASPIVSDTRSGVERAQLEVDLKLGSALEAVP